MTLRYPWMFGRQYDLCFFFLSFLVGLLFFQLTRPFITSSNVILISLIATAFGLGPFHQGATWFAYLDSQNRAHWKNHSIKRLVFFLGPFVIFALSIIAVFYSPGLLVMAWILWSIQHLVQQNVGILLLYHNYKAGEAIVNRQIEIGSQQMSAIFFTLILFWRTLSLTDTLPVFKVLIYGSAIVAIFLIMAYLVQTYRQLKLGRNLNVPAFGFWMLSIVCLWPMAFFGKDFASGFLAPLVWHWFQYIGLNFHMVRTKYKDERRKNLPLLKPVLLFSIVGLILIVVNLVLVIGSNALLTTDEVLRKIILGALLGFGFSHYFLDAFLWRFREPYQRETVLPYLKKLDPIIG